jgi:toxin ParE1/3/4
MLIRWTQPAAQDLTQISEYLEQHGSSAIARRVALSICHRIDQLADFPDLGRTGRKPNTRELVLLDLPYIAIYPQRHKYGRNPSHPARCAAVAVS